MGRRGKREEEDGGRRGEREEGGGRRGEKGEIGRTGGEGGKRKGGLSTEEGGNEEGGVVRRRGRRVNIICLAKGFLLSLTLFPSVRELWNVQLDHRLGRTASQHVGGRRSA